ncbi:hypothetical protein Nepgr_000163 [Nepenthes gracilis]|uniref:C2H2-type domain-containing protein n=1 Tax=Nepenthes gracilis TaxID=150966 RepID=A0AAD3RW20_NEPGR|nr:hypothetical protein Nepgr_000163 [Nepenthes gracilis]
MAGIASCVNKFIGVFLLLVHIGCFILPSSNTNGKDDENPPKRRKRQGFMSLSHLKPQKAFSSSWSFLKHIFSPKHCSNSIQTCPSTPALSSSARPSQHAFDDPIIPPDSLISDRPRKRRSGSKSGSDTLSENPFFPLRNNIFPCPSCGEIFPKPQLLEQHQSTKHAVSELHDGDSGTNIVWIIFKTGWTVDEKTPKIHRILKIHNSPKILSRFEEYRESVKAKAAARNDAVWRRDERCAADGNEMLRFHCTTFACKLGQNGDSSLCNQLFCSICGVIRSGFSPKLDGISTLSTSWRAHRAVPDDVEADFAFMNVKRAMLVCRVIAGRVACDQMAFAKADKGFDSVVSSNDNGGDVPKSADDELLVFNPRAVLPCFVVVYSV